MAMLVYQRVFSKIVPLLIQRLAPKVPPYLVLLSPPENYPSKSRWVGRVKFLDSSSNGPLC